MEINVIQQTSEIIAVKIVGKFNIEQAEQFDGFINSVLAACPRTVAIDFSEITYIDSSGLGSMIKAMNTVKGQGAEFILYDLPDNISKILQLAYLDKFFTIMSKPEFSAQHKI